MTSQPHAPVDPNTFEEIERLSQSVHGGIFAQHQVVAAGGGDEDDGGDVIEALDPLPPLVPLAAHVKHAASPGRRHQHGGLLQTTEQ